MERRHQHASHHRDLLTGAKQQQAASFQDSAAASAQLVRAVEAIVKVNSASQSQTCPPLLDKIATIHELDREIDRQLNCDIVQNYEGLLDAKHKLARHVKRCQRALAIVPDKNGSYVDLLQRRTELIDQELRILEHTSLLVKENHHGRNTA